MTSTDLALNALSPTSQVGKRVWVLGGRHKAEPREAPDGARWADILGDEGPSVRPALYYEVEVSMNKSGSITRLCPLRVMLHLKITVF